MSDQHNASSSHTGLVAGQDGAVSVRSRSDAQRSERRGRALRQAAARVVCEHLEHRTLMSASAWTGAGSDSNLSTPANWQGTAAPAPGNDVTFGAAVANQVVTVDVPTTVGAVAFTAGGYAVGSNGDALTVTGGISDTGGSDAISAPLTLAASQAVSVAGSDTLTVSGDTNDTTGGYGLTKAGAGTLDLSGTDTYGGTTTVTDGTLQVDGLLLSNVTLAGGTTLAGTGIVGSIASTGGNVVPGDDGTGDGTLTAIGGMTLDAASTLTLSIDGNTPGNGAGNFGQVSTGGNVALGGATLSLSLGADYAPAAGDVLTLVNNGGTNPVTGTFAGLAQGSLLTLGGNTFRLSYAGGDGNDVTLSYLQSSTVTLASSAAPGYLGQALTFTATVASTDGTGGTPTGTVSFFDNGAALGSAQTVNGSGQATLSVPGGLSIGTYAITAVYSGDAAHQTGTSAPLSQVITAPATLPVVTSSTAGASVFGQSVTFTVAVSVVGGGAGTPAGTVTFKDGSTTLGTATLSGASATLTTAALSTATHTITVVYAGNGSYAGSTSAALTQTVAKASAAVTLSSNLSNTVYGQPVAYTAHVAVAGAGAGTPGGTVTFKDGGTTLGTATLNGSGVATLTNTALSVATHTVTAVYGGNTNFLTATSGGLTQVVAQAATRAVVSSSQSGSVFGQSVTLSAILAVVSPGSGTPTGSVTFYDNGTALGTASLSTGRATLATAGLSVGSHAVTVVYAGDTNHAALTSAAFTQAVARSPISVALTSSAAPAVSGQTVTYTVTAAASGAGAGTPTGGTVTLTDESGNTIGTGTLTAGSVTITGSALPVGDHTLTAAYAGDVDFLTGASAATDQVVGRAASTVAVTSSVAPTVAGESVTFTATLAVTAPGVATPTGTVSFYDGDTSHLLGTGTVSAGAATFTTSTLSTGAHTIFAVYAGDTNVAGSQSPTLTLAANQDPTTTSVTSSAGSTTFGQAVTFTATATANAPGTGTPTGTVTFYAGGVPIGTTQALSAGTASITVATLAVGTRTITAVYGGDADYATSTSAGITQTVALATTATAVTSSASPSAFGQSVTFTGAVTVTTGAGTPTGTLQFSVDGSVVATRAVAADGTATYTASALTVAGHTVGVTYSGDAAFVGSTAATLTQTVNAATTTTAVTSSSPAAPFGQAVTLTATVATALPGTGLPVGATVTFREDGSTIGTGTVLSDGTATLSGVTPTVGAHAITATVAAATGYATSTSGTFTQTVTAATTTVTVTTANTLFGASATLTATVAITAGVGTPTGTVSFYDGSTLIGTGTVNGGTTATFATAALSVGTHAITATYGGDAGFATATGVAAQVVARAASTVAVTSSAGPSVAGQSVTFTATLAVTTPGVATPTGTVSFYDVDTTHLLGTGSVSAGAATFTTATLSTGSHSVFAVYAGDTDVAGSTSAILGQTVGHDATTTTVTSSAGSAAFGQSVTFTATAAANAPGAGTPTGTVMFYAGGVQIGTTQTLSAGTASVTVATLAVGTPSITATYGGDANFTGGTSAGLTQTITAAATTVSLVSGDIAPTNGQTITLTATVAPTVGSAVPTGTVTFRDNGVQVGSPVTVTVNGTATLTASFAAGTHPLTATYANTDGDFVGSTTSPALSQVVSADAVTIGVAASNTTPAHGQSVTFTATVAAAAPGAGTPTGIVTFLDNGVTLGTGTLSGGVATLSTSALTTAAHDITATYNGDAGFATGASADHAVDVTVARSATTVVIGATSTTGYGGLATITATVAATAPGAGTPTGTVTFYADGNTGAPIGTGTVNGSGVATMTTATLSAGTHAITAAYGGDGNFLTGATSAGVNQVVNVSATGTALVLASASSTYDTSVTMTATVSATAPGAGTPTGTVGFYDGSTLLGTGTLSGGVASYAAWGLAVGSHTISATYGGDANNDYATSTSATATETVSAGATTTAVTADVGPSVFGQQVTFTAAVAPGSGSYGTGVTAVGGTVTFYSDGVSIGTGAVGVNGHATLTTPGLSVATHAITATYGGDARYATSTSSSLSQTVGQATVTVGVASSAGASVYGQSVTLTTTVNAVLPAVGTATGTVTFFADGVQIGTAQALSAGQASVTTSALSVASHAVTATYSGDADFSTATGAITQVVTKDAVVVALTSDSGVAVAGQTVGFLAVVSAAAPGAGTATGTVTFYSDGVALGGPVAVDGSGHATFSTATLTTAGHTITAVYGGDADFLSNTSNSLSQTETQDPTTVSAALSGSTLAYGQPLSVTATVTANSPGSGTATGTVTFYDTTGSGTVSLGQATLSGGLATLAGLTPAAGSHAITAIYSGDANFATSTTASASALTVTAAQTTVTLGGTTTGVFGQALGLSATVAVVAPGVGTPVGSVAFYDGGTLLGTTTLNGSGVATLSATLSVASHAVTAVYVPTGTNFATSTTASATTVTVSAAQTTVTLGGDTAGAFGQTLGLTATVAVTAPGVGTPVGSVNFYNGGTLIGTTAVNGSGIAALSTTLPVGSDAVTATYAPSGINFAASTTASATTVTVTAAQTTVTLGGATTGVFGQALGLTATVAVVSPGVGTPVGSVSFYDGSTLLGTSTPDGSGLATLSTTLPVGSDAITATYVPSGTNFVTSGANATVTVAAAQTTVTVGGATGGLFGQTLSLTATVAAVSPAVGTPVGSVNFYNGSTLIGTSTLDGSGLATLSTTLPVGSDAVTATYVPTGTNFATSTTASTTTVTVSAAQTTVVLGGVTSGLFGQALSLTATVAAVSPAVGTPVGSVNFYDGSTLVGTSNLNGSGTATLSTTLPVGSNAVTATYVPTGSNFATSNTASATTVTVAAAQTTVTLGGVTSGLFGQTLSLTATVAAVSPAVGTPVGTVAFYNGGNLIGTTTLNGSGVAALSTTLPVGSDAVTAIYLPTGTNFVTSTTASATTVTVAAAQTTVVLGGATSGLFGQVLSLTATVAAVSPAVGTPVGSVNFYDGSTLVGTATLNGSGLATLSTTLPVGANAVTATYVPTGVNFVTSNTTSATTVTVAAAQTMVTLGGATSGLFGQVLSLTATVAAVSPAVGTPVGVVAFFDAGLLIGTSTLDGSGLATVSTTLPVGSDAVSATYVPIGTNFVASGATAVVTVAAAQTTVTLGGATTGSLGQALSLTATVAAVSPAVGTPVGTVAFYCGGNLIGTTTLNGSGVAALSTTLPVGSDAVTATYLPTGTNFVTSTTASATTVTVAAAQTTVVLGGATSGLFGQALSLTATVAAVSPAVGTPVGSVNFYDGSTLVGTSTLNGSGLATLSTALPVGANAVTATYVPTGANFVTSNTTSATTVTVAAAQTTVTLGGATTGLFGQVLSLTATVAAVSPAVGTPVGSVNFYDGATLIGTTTVGGSGTATLATSLAVGSHTVSATYVPTGTNFVTSTTGSPTTVTVGAAATTVTLGGDTGGVFGQTLGLTATVAAVSPAVGTPVGSVAFHDGTTLIGTSALNGSGVATLSTTLPVGSDAVTATYVPTGANFLASTTGSTETVSAALTTVTLGGATAGSFGQTLGLTATVAVVSPGVGTPSGSVGFYDGSTLLGTSTLNGSGVATLSTTLPVGSNAVTATYVPDQTNFAASTTTAADTVAVGAAATTVSLGGSTSGVFGQPVAVTATVAVTSPGVGVPTGSVTFHDGSAVLGTATVNGTGVASLLVAPPAGANTITATYVPTGSNFAASTSTVGRLVTVAPAQTTVALANASGVYGQPLSLSATLATVSPGVGVPTGSVAFYDGNPANGGSLLGTATADGTGTATLVVTPTVGAHAIYAVFTPSVSGFVASSLASPASVVVARAATSVTLSASAPTAATPAAAGTSTLTAMLAVVSPGAGAPGGAIAFYDGTTLLGTATPANGVATLAVTGLAGGTHSFTAAYAGDANFLAATSPAVGATVAMPGALQFSAASESVPESAGTATVTVTRTGGTDGAVSVGYAVSGGTAINGTDFVLAAGTLAFAAGQSSATVAIPLIDGGLYGADKTVILSLSTPTGGAALAATTTNILTIANAHVAPTVSIGNATVTVSPTGAGLATFALTLSAPSDLPTVVNFQTVDGSATAGTDYLPIQAYTVIAPGQTSLSLGIAIPPTTAFNPTRTFTLVPYAPTNATLAASPAGTGTILNVNYPAPTLTNVSATVAPGAQATFTPLTAASSYDGTPLTLSVLTQPAGGSVVLTGNQIVYTRAAGSFAGDTFIYQVTDDHGVTATGTATVAVQGVGLVASPITAGASDLVVVGTAGNDTITFRPVAGVKTGVRATVNGVASATFKVSGRLIALGGDGDDVITAPGTTQPAWFYGGAGNDTLTGAGANDVLVGGAGNDLLTGGGGRNVLIGGDGADTLRGSGSADMLVADATAYDAPTPANQSALAQIQAAWVARKVHAVQASAGFDAGGAALTPGTITSDGSADVLVGKKGDWYFGDFAFAGGNSTFTDGRHAEGGKTLTPTRGELVTQL